jgi:hypothetical protein
MTKFIAICLVVLTILSVYGLIIWGLLKFHRYHLKKSLLKTFRKAVENGEITKEQGDLFEWIINEIYKNKTWKKY